MLRLNGYSRAAFGKSHETAAWELSPSGPTDRWPTRSGFDKFYGFLGGETNQWSPLIYDGLSQVELPKDPNYHFMTDMTNQASATTLLPGQDNPAPSIPMSGAGWFMVNWSIQVSSGPSHMGSDYYPF